MKSGDIVYVAGIAPVGWSEDEEVELKRMLSDADRVEIITTQTGHVDVSDAWRALVAGGMAMVTCRLARFGDAGRIEMTDKALRLCG